MKLLTKEVHFGVEFYTPEKCYIIELFNTPNDPTVSLAQARVAPGTTTRWHRLMGITERYLILVGNGCVEVGDCPPQMVGVGDKVIIPPAHRQRITNTGQADLIFLAICTPRFCLELYEDVDNSP